MKNRIVTIPNLLSLCRIAMIVPLVYLYAVADRPGAAGLVLILSGLTDVADGFIARRFHMISDVGKVLDPIADKLTQGVMLICLLLRDPMMALPLALLFVKETFMAVSGYLVIRRKGVVLGANWHGKAATCLLYAMMFLHMLVPGMPEALSAASILASSGMIALSLALYALRNVRMLRGEGDWHAR